MKSIQGAQNRAGVFSALMLMLLLSPLTLQGAASADAKMPTVKMGENVVKLEVAASPEEIERGLMHRTSLPEDQGMVFLFHPPRPVNFWMFHTLIPLDMLFVKEGKIVRIFHDVPPCKSEDPSKCPLYPGGEGLEVSEVIELNGGYAKRHHVHEGEHIKLELQ